MRTAGMALDVLELDLLYTICICLIKKPCKWSSWIHVLLLLWPLARRQLAGAAIMSAATAYAARMGDMIGREGVTSLFHGSRHLTEALFEEMGQEARP